MITIGFYGTYEAAKREAFLGIEPWPHANGWGWSALMQSEPFRPIEKISRAGSGDQSKGQNS